MASFDTTETGQGQQDPKGDKQASYRHPPETSFAAREQHLPGGADSKARSPKLRGPEMGNEGGGSAGSSPIRPFRVTAGKGWTV